MARAVEEERDFACWRLRAGVDGAEEEEAEESSKATSWLLFVMDPGEDGTDPFLPFFLLAAVEDLGLEVVGFLLLALLEESALPAAFFLPPPVLAFLEVGEAAMGHEGESWLIFTINYGRLPLAPLPPLAD